MIVRLFNPDIIYVRLISCSFNLAFSALYDVAKYHGSILNTLGMTTFLRFIWNGLIGPNTPFFSLVSIWS